MNRRFLLSALPAAAVLARNRQAGAAAAQPAKIGIMGGEIDGTFMRIATDLTSVMNSDTLRVVPVVGKGSVQNLDDLLHLPGVDLALIAADVLAYARAENLYPREISKVQYICKLYDNDMHVCARPEIQALSDLQGKPVNIDVEGAGTNMTARAIFKTLGIQPEFRTEEPTVGQERLRRGEIAANVYVAGKPVRLFTSQPPDTGLHFLPVVSNPELEKTYLPGGEFSHDDYPTLIPAGESVETVGVGVALAVLAWPPGTPRYRNLVTFVDTFFTRFPELLKKPHHAKWHDVNLAAEQPGWVRFAPAAAWLAQHHPGNETATGAAPSNEQTNFDQFLAQKGVPTLTPAQRDAAWQYFQQQRPQGH